MFRILSVVCVLIGLMAIVARPCSAATVVVTSSGDAYVCVNQTATITFSASVSGAPTSTQECEIVGPYWSWSNSGGGSLTSSGGSSATISVSFSAPGNYTIGAGATVTYLSSCSGGNVTASGSASVTVHVGGWGPWTTVAGSRTDPAVTGYGCVPDSQGSHWGPLGFTSGSYTQKRTSCDGTQTQTKTCTLTMSLTDMDMDSSGNFVYTYNITDSCGGTSTTTQTQTAVCCSCGCG